MFEINLRVGAESQLKLTHAAADRFVHLAVSVGEAGALVALNKQEVQRIVNALVIMLEEL